jgi:hypothetical protein
VSTTSDTTLVPICQIGPPIDNLIPVWTISTATRCAKIGIKAKDGTLRRLTYTQIGSR